MSAEGLLIPHNCTSQKFFKAPRSTMSIIVLHFYHNKVSNISRQMLPYRGLIANSAIQFKRLSTRGKRISIQIRHQTAQMLAGPVQVRDSRFQLHTIRGISRKNSQSFSKAYGNTRSTNITCMRRIKHRCLIRYTFGLSNAI